MADGKWISELTPQTPVTDAARRVLLLRLEVVRDYLPLAVREPDEDPEHVHQLRVGTRRAGAALEIFACCLPDKAYERARKMLRRIRRAAGAVRDWDVFLLGLGAVGKQAPRRQPAGDFLAGHALAQRQAAQTQLEDACPDFPFSFPRLLAETVAAVHKPKGDECPRALLDLARSMLGKLLRELHDAASQDLSDYDHLHQVRIIGKRLRYAMEVFVDCFAPAFKQELYPAVEGMQEILGEANDSHVAGHRLADLREHVKMLRADDWKRYRPGFDALLRHHKQRLAQRHEQFIDWWAKWQESGGETAFAALVKQAKPLAEEQSELNVPAAKPSETVSV